MSGDTQGIPEPGICYRVGFFENYQLLRKQGAKERQRNSSFNGIPCLEEEVALEVFNEFTRWDEEGKYVENYQNMFQEVCDSNPEVYNHAASQIGNIKMNDNKKAYLMGFLSMIELLRRGHFALNTSITSICPTIDSTILNPKAESRKISKG